MALYTSTITADGDTKLIDVRLPRGKDKWVASVYIYGTFGSGTATLKASPDAGTTKITLKDSLGNNIATTAAAVYLVELGGTDKNAFSQGLYLTLSGATNPNLTVRVFDNL